MPAFPGSTLATRDLEKRTSFYDRCNQTAQAVRARARACVSVAPCFGGASTLVDFDDLTAPCDFPDQVPLTNEYQHLRVFWSQQRDGGPGRVWQFFGDRVLWPQCHAWNVCCVGTTVETLDFAVPVIASPSMSDPYTVPWRFLGGRLWGGPMTRRTAT